jgi:hypothetical protein
MRSRASPRFSLRRRGFPALVIGVRFAKLQQLLHLEPKAVKPAQIGGTRTD